MSSRWVPLRKSIARGPERVATMRRRGPISRELIRFRTWCQMGRQRRVWSMESTVPLAWQAAIMRSASARVVAMGFSQ